MRCLGWVQVWEKYTATANLLRKEGMDSDGVPAGKLLCSTIAENEGMMRELLGVEPQVGALLAL
jgi:hypothetical protein